VAEELSGLRLGLRYLVSARVPAVVGVVEYGAGNIQSLVNAVEFLGAEVRHLDPEASWAGVSHVILPGVGAFGFCADRLRASGLLPALTDWAMGQRRPVLGICVGMQLLAETSEELGRQQGLGWLGGEVRKLESASAETRIPHVGWNDVRFLEDFGECGRGAAPDFYFDHSFAYTTPVRGRVVGTCEHGRTFCAVVRHENIVGAQFHPEKSQEAGQRFLRSFLRL
jgi:glutamine amidotransferase